MVRWKAETAGYERDVEQARVVLGSDEFDRLWAEGGALPPGDAVAYAGRARGERRRPSFGWESLTPTEQRVVALVVEGLTNPQIGDRLFMARGTVKTHLGHIFAKLDVTTRAELAVAAVRHRPSG